MFAGDRWIKDAAHGRNGDYVWLPMEFEGDTPIVRYHQSWELNASTGCWRPFDPSRNLASGKPVTASSEMGTHLAKNVTASKTYDDYAGSYWESAQGNPQWITVDLRAPSQINRVILKWNARAAREFKIQTSTDGAAWTDVYTSTTGSSSMLNDRKFPATTARYIRVYATQLAPLGMQRRFRSSTIAPPPAPSGYSLFDFMVLKD
jgi:hypothetical protein